MKSKHKQLTASLLIMIIIIFILVAAVNSQGFKRSVKTWQSDMGGGLNRTVTLYDYSGNEIRHWTGKFDVTESDQETSFDIDGKRVIIQGGIVVNEEN